MSLSELGKYQDLLETFAAITKVGGSESRFADATSKILGAVDLDNAIKNFRQLGVEGDDLISVLKNCGIEEEKIAEALSKTGTTGTKMTQKLGTAFAGLAGKIGLTTGQLAGLTLGIAGVSLAFAGWKMYQNYIQGLVDKAREAGEAWSKTNDTFEAQTDKIRELRTSLDEGALSEQDAYAAKSDLYEIQKSLIDTYGKQAEGIDLVNGKIEEEIAEINKLSAAQASAFLNENDKGIKTAETEMEKTREMTLRRLGYVSTSDMKILREAMSKYSDFIKLDNSGGLNSDASVELVFTGDATQAEEVLNQFMNDLRARKGEFSDINLFEGLMSGVSSKLNEASAVLENYQSIYEQAKHAQLISDFDSAGNIRKYDYGNDSKSAAQWANDYAEAVDKYNKALASGDTSAIEAARTEFDNIDAAVSSLTKGSMSAFSEQIGDIKEQLNEAAVAEYDFVKTFEGANKGLVDAIKAANIDDVTLLSALNDADFDAGEEAFRNLMDIAVESGAVAEGEYEKLVAILVKLGIVSSNTANQTGAATDAVAQRFSSTGEIITSFGEKIDNVQSRVSTLGDAFTKLRDGSITLEEVVDLIQQFPELAEYVDLAAENFGNLDAGLRKAISDTPTALIDELQNLKETSDLTDRQKQSIDSLCAAMSQIPTDAIKNASDEFGVLADSINAARKAQNELEKALSEDDYDQGYSDRVDAFSGFEEIIKSGKYGSKAFAAYKEYFGLVDKDSAQIKKWMSDNKKYFSEGESGIKNFMNTIDKLDGEGGALEGIASFDSKAGTFNYDINRLSEFADVLGWTEEMLQDFIDKYRTYCEVWQDRTAQENLTELTNKGLIVETDNGVIAFLDQMAAKLDITKEKARELIDEINIMNNPTLASKGLVQTFTNSDGTVSMNFTPVMTDENGNYIGTMSSDELRAYAMDVISGVREDDLNLQMGATFKGADSLKKAEEAADKLRQTHQKLMEAGSNGGIQLIGVDQVTLTQDVIDKMLQAGSTAEEVKKIIADLNNAGLLEFEDGITIDGQTIEDVLAEQLAGAEGEGTVNITVNLAAEGQPEVLAVVQTTVDEAKRILGEEKLEAILSADDQASNKVVYLEELIAGLDNDKATVWLAEGKGSSLVRSNFDNFLQTLKDIQTYSKINLEVNGEVPQQNAKGTKHAKEGPSLLGDEYSPTGAPKPELVVSNGEAYIAGQSGPEIGYLNEGDIVYNADDTRKILSSNSAKNTIQAHAGGTANGLFGGSSGGSGKHGGSKGGYSSGSGNSINDDGFDDKVSSKFEELYAYHQHLLAMDLESLKEYLEWLEEAYKEAYEKGKISKEDYWKYAEEVYEGLKELFQDYLSDMEHQIEMTINEGGSNQAVINMYIEMMEAIEAEIAAAKEAGLDENDDYIQELQGQWWDYQEEIKDIQETIKEDASDAVEDMIDYRIDMLKQDLENERDALNDKLDALRDFYQKQKDMLQDAYDEEQYLEEQAEKRKSVETIEEELSRLELDTSAWAKKRRQELLDDLADAKKDLEDFEKQHVLESAKEMLDNLLEKQEEGLNSEIDEIEKKMDDAKSLYEQALNDIRNGSVALYEEMIAYNAQYGDGIDDSVTQMWETAYVSLQKYFELYNEYYKGINLPNVTGYVAPVIDSSGIKIGSGYASGTNKATAGLHRVDEDGDEYVFTTSDGKRYRMFSGGEKVLNAGATDFLYKFATSGGAFMDKLFDTIISKVPSVITANKSVQPQIAMGDIIVQGNADQSTVSAIRREKREEMQWILKEFNKMNKRM